jgi:hypothetical protein
MILWLPHVKEKISVNPMAAEKRADVRMDAIIACSDGWLL